MARNKAEPPVTQGNARQHANLAAATTVPLDSHALSFYFCSMGKVKGLLGEAPPTLGSVLRLGATALLVACPPPCKRRSRIEIAALRLPDETPYDEVTRRRRFVCSACDRRAGPAAISIDWDVTASKPLDGR